MLSEKQIKEFERMVADLKEWTYWNRADMPERDGNKLASLSNDLVGIAQDMRQNQGERVMRSVTKKAGRG